MLIKTNSSRVEQAKNLKYSSTGCPFEPGVPWVEIVNALAITAFAKAMPESAY
jgi:hypothetical protein